MTLSLALIVLSAASTSACRPLAAGETAAISTEQAAVAAAKEAWRDKFSDASVREREPYRAKFADGIWQVNGTLPAGWRGGTPEAVICASDGKVLRVFHSR
ncbi:MAG: hypothetical protein EON58_06135 [Alphaproteobacteria bacterium]|nr:MAG: hypothetical protein EON58_06135 [Alphaproteobacteria bacterium]